MILFTNLGTPGVFETLQNRKVADVGIFNFEISSGYYRCPSMQNLGEIVNDSSVRRHFNLEIIALDAHGSLLYGSYLSCICLEDVVASDRSRVKLPQNHSNAKAKLPPK